MSRFLDLTLNGVVDGMIYAAAALSLVLIWRATRVLNFALPGMAMLTTYLAYTVIEHGNPYWLGFLVALVTGLLLGAVVEVGLVRRVENGPPLNPVIVTLGLLVVLEAIAGMIYGGNFRPFPTALSGTGLKVGGSTIALSRFDLFLIGAVLVLMLGLLALFQRTDIGLRMRAAAFEQEVARLLGVRVGRMFTLGWALASAAGSLVGVLVAPTRFLYPSFLETTLVFGFTAAVIGGLDSPGGAVVGGLGLGLSLAYVDGYLGSDLVTVAALVVLLVVLMLRPGGLFTRLSARRV